MAMPDLDVAAIGAGSRSQDASPDAGAAKWRAESECRRHPTRWWFNGDHQETVLAKSICSGCLVREPCLEFALARPDMAGIWASTTATDRAAIRRDRREPAPEAPIPGAGIAVPVPPVAVAHTSTISRVRPAARPDPGPGPVVDAADLLTPAEAARRLGVTPNTVTRWSRAGKISAIQTMGGHRRFPRNEIERVLREGGLFVATSF